MPQQYSRPQSPRISSPIVSPAGEEETEEDFDSYDITPPTLLNEKQRTFKQVVEAIQNDFDLLRLQEVNGKWEWYNIKTGREMSRDSCRILLFLYSRQFMIRNTKDARKASARSLLRNNLSKQRLLHILECTGDTDLSGDFGNQHNYLRACTTVMRYFDQDGAVGFREDMSTMKYFIRRQQKGNSCFLQAPCVTMSYLLQAFGKDAPPANASRLIRNSFSDEQLFQYAKDMGGDSCAIFKILEKKYFSCSSRDRSPEVFLARKLNQKTRRDALADELQQVPAMISKFAVPLNFKCASPSDDMREQYPHLDAEISTLEREGDASKLADVWNHLPSESIPPGIARFTEWNEPAEFIVLKSPSDDLLQRVESQFRKKLKEHSPNKCDGAVRGANAECMPESSSVERSYCGGNSSHTCCASTNDTFSEGDNLSSLFSGCEDEDDSWSTHDNSYNRELVEGTADEGQQLHAMVLLGRRRGKNGSDWWLLQNSWAGPMQIIEVSTDFLRQSEASICIYSNDGSREPKSEREWEAGNLESLACRSPIAESCELERSDCESWFDSVIYGKSQPLPDEDEENFFDEL